MPPQNYRYDEFLDLDQSVLVTGEACKVPASSPYYWPLAEIPREDSPSTILVRTAGSSSTVNPDQDCYVTQDATGTNYNTNPMLCGRQSLANGGELSRAFIRFDISALPSGASSAILRLYIRRGLVATTCGVHQVTATWTETGPTWTTPPAYNSVPSSQITMLAAPSNSPTVYEWVECDITTLYNTWKAGSNYGLMLKVDESVYDTEFEIYDRSTSTAPAGPPQLVVTSAGNYYTEVGASIAPAAGEFAAHYGTGRLRFHSSAAGLSLDVDYRGAGSAVDAANTPQYCTTAGSANTYTATIDAFAGALRQGYMVFATFNVANTGASTLNINGIGAKTIQRLGFALTTGQIQANTTYCLYFDGTYFQMIGL